MPVVTALRGTRRGRIEVYVDGELACTVGEAAVAHWRLHKGRELDQDGLEALARDASADLARSDAYRLLGHRARSAAEVRRRLLAREHPPEAVDAAMRSLADEGLLDDAAFACSYVADKRRLTGWGEERIRRGLADAGVTEEHIRAALGASSEDERDDAELERAREVLRRRAPAAAPRDDAARRRAYQLLVRRGFASGVAYAAVRSWSAAAKEGEAGAGAAVDDDEADG